METTLIAPERESIPPPPDDPSRRRDLPSRRPSLTRSGWITAAIAVLTTVVYTWNLSANGYANEYYTAAVRSASVSWKAFFGSIDSGNFITVDKPPAALWLQALSVRIFGFSSWAMLVPEALCGVASVLILHRMVRRWAGDTAAHLAALALALTPVAVLMFRFNNPDALLTLLCVAAAWALWSALELGRTRWLVVSGALIGLAFNTKMLQAFVVLPAFAVVYLVAGKPRLLKRLAQLSVALAAVVVASGWWIAIVALWPAADRPYIGSTTDNSILSLLFGYNGLSRLFGSSGGGPGGGAPGGGGAMSTGFGGAVGWLRMFNTANGGQIAWLIPLAVAGLAAGLWLTRRAPRTDLARAGWLLWGIWAVSCFVTFSRAQGIFHPYYTVQLAPPLAALAGAGGLALWRLGRSNRWLRWALPTAILATAALAVALLDQTPSYLPWLRPLIVGGAVVAVVGLWLGSQLRRKALVVAAAAVATATLLAGPAAFAYTTVHTAATGSIVFAGPSASTGGPGGAGAGGAGFGGAGPGGGTSSADDALITYLEANRGDATYLVAAFGSQSSASIIIATGQPVVTIGGFSGGDPAPTLEQFKAMVATGEVRFILISGIGGGPGGGAGGSGSGSAISSWATANGTAVLPPPTTAAPAAGPSTTSPPPPDPCLPLIPSLIPTHPATSPKGTPDGSHRRPPLHTPYTPTPPTASTPPAPPTPPEATDDDGWWFDQPSDPADPTAAPGRHRSVRTWVVAGVGAAAIALASVVGINIASSHISSTATAATSPGGLGQGGFGPGGPGGTPGRMGTSGTIASIDGSTLTVTTPSGSTTVTTSGSTTVTESVTGSPGDIAVGDTVTVRGSGSGTDAVTATEITDEGTVAAGTAGAQAGAMPPGAQAGGPPAGVGGARGTVTAVDGSTLTVASPDGTTVTVSTSDATVVTIAKASSVSALTTGETVRVIGATGSDGTVAATRIMAGDTGFGGPGAMGGPPDLQGTPGSSGSNGSSTPPTTT